MPHNMYIIRERTCFHSDSTAKMYLKFDVLFNLYFFFSGVPTPNIYKIIFSSDPDKSQE